MRCYAVLDTFRELEAFFNRAVYRHSEEFWRSLNKTKLVESGVKYSLLIFRKMVCCPQKTEHAQYAERFRECD